jgi:hypothetical protein
MAVIQQLVKPVLCGGRVNEQDNYADNKKGKQTMHYITHEKNTAEPLDCLADDGYLCAPLDVSSSDPYDL